MEIVLFCAIMIVESGGNPAAVNKAEKAVGVVQIRPIVVEDVNRICRLRGSRVRFKLSDRTDVGKSYQMWLIYTGHYAPGTNWEKKARVWNGGPRGHLKKATRPYWNKVRAVMRSH